MSELLFSERESEQRRQDAMTAGPRPPSFDLGYLGERTLQGFFVAAPARLAEGVIGPGLDASARFGRTASRVVSDITGIEGDASIWDEIQARAEEGMRHARRHRIELDAADPARDSWASNMAYQLSQMLAVGTVGTALGGAAGTAAALGPSYGVPAYNDFIDEGMPEPVARNAALIEGLSMSALGALPVR